MSNQVAKPASGALMPRSIIADMAERFGMEKEAFEAVLMKTIMPANATKEQTVAFLVVAKQYDLNPFTKEIYAFPAKGGGITPMVPIDGWLKIINSNPDYDGCDFADHINGDGELTAITCRVYHKRRSHPIEVTEYMTECKRRTEPWSQWPARMLRHKAMIQSARYAFGFAGIMEQDEYERMQEITPQAISSPVGSGVSGLRHALSNKTAGRDEPQGQQEAVEHQQQERADFNQAGAEAQPAEAQPAKSEPAQAQPDPETSSDKPAGRSRPRPQGME